MGRGDRRSLSRPPAQASAVNSPAWLPRTGVFAPPRFCFVPSWHPADPHLPGWMRTRVPAPTRRPLCMSSARLLSVGLGRAGCVSAQVRGPHGGRVARRGVFPRVQAWRCKRRVLVGCEAPLFARVVVCASGGGGRWGAVGRVRAGGAGCARARGWQGARGLLVSGNRGNCDTPTAYHSYHGYHCYHSYDGYDGCPQGQPSYRRA